MTRKKRVEGTVFRLGVARGAGAEMGGEPRMNRAAEISEVLPPAAIWPRAWFGCQERALEEHFRTPNKKARSDFHRTGLRLMAL